MSAPWVILTAGVNGTGKTTTIGKLAARMGEAGKKVLLVAGDTFRAAAVEQLEIWARRVGAGFHGGKEGADPSSVIFDGIKRAQNEHLDVVICDTAGRLHTKTGLMEELQKVRRVAGKAHEGAPHETLLVLDATTGQNAIAQAQTFKQAIEVTGLVLTKLDGTAKGGVVLGVCEELGLPVRYLGIGERVEDLRDFDAEAFADALLGDLEGADGPAGQGGDK
jgi:fused signal recognition particle receptor